MLILKQMLMNVKVCGYVYVQMGEVNEWYLTEISNYYDKIKLPY